MHALSRSPVGTNIHLFSKVYTADNLTGTVIPNIGDMVIDYSVGMWEVTHVALVVELGETVPTYFATLVPFDPTNLANSSADSLISGLTGYQPRISDRAYYVSSVGNLFEINIDDRYVATGSEVVTCRVFRGTDTSPLGDVISNYTDAESIWHEELIHLVPLKYLDSADNLVDNPTVKRIPTFTTDAILEDGEHITVLMYTDTGRVIGEHTFIVKLSDVYLPSIANLNPVTDIFLYNMITEESIPAGNTVIMASHIQPDFNNYAIEVVRRNFPTPVADVAYSKKGYELVNLNDSSIKMYGAELFNANLISTTSDLVFMYGAAPGEPIVNSEGVSDDRRFISKTYKLQPKTWDNDFKFQVFMVPSWNATSEVYDFTYYLHEVMRQGLIVIPDQYVSVTRKNFSNGIFERGIPDYVTDPVQTIEIAVDMENWTEINTDGSYTNFTFKQAVRLELADPLSIKPWTISYLGGNSLNTLGAHNLLEINPSSSGTDVLSLNASGYYDPEESPSVNLSLWIENTYKSLNPIFDPTNGELFAPNPDYFQLRWIDDVGAVHLEEPQPIATWTIPQTMSTNVTDLTTIEIRWLLDVSGDGTGFEYLGISPLLAKNR